MVEVSGGLEWTYQYFWDPDLGYLSERTPLKDDRTLDVDILNSCPSDKSINIGESKKESVSLIKEKNRMRQEIDVLKKEVETLRDICDFQEKKLQDLSPLQMNGLNGREAVHPGGGQIPTAMKPPPPHHEGRTGYNPYPHFRPHDQHDYYESHYLGVRAGGPSLWQGPQVYSSSRMSDPIAGHYPPPYPRPQYHHGYYDHHAGEGSHYHPRRAFRAPPRPHSKEPVKLSKEMTHQHRAGRYPPRGDHSSAQQHYPRDRGPPKREAGPVKAKDKPAPFEAPLKEAPKSAEPLIINPNSVSRASAPNSGSRAKRPRSDSRNHRPQTGKPVINVSEDKTKSLPAKSAKSVADPVGEPNPYANVVPPKQVKSSSEVDQSKQKSSV